MIAVQRAYGLQFAIYADDHAPPHVHVYGNGQAKIGLVGANACPNSFARVLQIWSDIHG
jgi:hypothetical protein